MFVSLLPRMLPTH